MNETKVLIEKITEGIQEKKGKNIVIADLNQRYRSSKKIKLPADKTAESLVKLQADVIVLRHTT